MRKMFGLTLAIALCASMVSAIEFTKEIEPRDLTCFSESLGELIMLKYITKSEFGQWLRVWIQRPDMTIWFDETGKGDTRFSQVTEQEGDFLFCVENKSEKLTISVDIQFVTGPEARDFSDQPTKEDGVKFQTSAQRLENIIKDIKHEKHMLLKTQQHATVLTKDITFKIQGFSIITGALLIALGVLQAYYMNQFFKEKKMI